MNKFQTGYVALIRAALTEEIPVTPDDFDYSRAFALAQEFGLTSLLYRGARKDPAFASYPDKLEIVKQSCREIATNNNQMALIKRMSQSFDAEGLDYCLLKGSEIKKLYPSPELRPMGDIDILIHGEEYGKIEKIMERLGCTFGKESDHDYAWSSSEGTRIELHKRIHPGGVKFSSYFDDVWDYVDGHYLKPELSYLHQVMHFLLHTYCGSAPMKHIVDLYIYRKAHPEMDLLYVESELRKLQLTTFHESIVKVIDVWFYEGTADRAADILIDMVFYPWEKRRKDASNIAGARGIGKAKHSIILHKIFASRKKMTRLYPVLEKYPYLLPLCWIRRAITFLTVKRKETVGKLQRSINADLEEYIQYEQRMKVLGLVDIIDE